MECGSTLVPWLRRILACYDPVAQVPRECGRPREPSPRCRRFKIERRPDAPVLPPQARLNLRKQTDLGKNSGYTYPFDVVAELGDS
jgi:hypothetical protein